MVNRYITFYTDASGNLQASPDPLHVYQGDVVIWTNGESEDYTVTAFSPTLPPLFSCTSINLPKHNASAPATVQANPAAGVPLTYKYSCVSTGADGKVLDPIIIVDPPVTK
jgi:hypothetical protein